MCQNKFVYDLLYFVYVSIDSSNLLFRTAQIGLHKVCKKKKNLSSNQCISIAIHHDACVPVFPVCYRCVVLCCVICSSKYLID